MALSQTITVVERPRERLLARGASRLHASELIALVLGSGVAGAPAEVVASRLLASSGGLEPLSRSRPGELLDVGGVGTARAARLVACFELGRRALEVPRDEPLTSAEHVFRRMRTRLVGLAQEVGVVLALSAQNRLIAEVEIARGEATSIPVHPREVFRPLIRHGAVAGIFVHNHPSGDPKPSGDDIALTHRLAEVGALVGIPLLDHVIVASGGYTSILEYLGEL